MSLLEGANIYGDSTIFGGGPLNAELRSLFVNHLAGATVTPGLHAKTVKHALSQSICNLPRAKAAYDDYSSKGKKRASCFRNTMQALLKEAGKWIFAIPDKPEIFLLSGLAGTGKSTVAQTIAERADNLHLLGASFFFSRDEADRRSAEKFYTTIAFQLCSYDERFAQAIGDVLLNQMGTVATSMEPMEQLDTLIVEPLRHLVNQRSRPLVIVIDALDECYEEDGLAVLETLEHLVHELPSFKVFLTGRRSFPLRIIFDNHRIFHRQDTENKVTDNDIRLYLKYRLSCEQVTKRLKLKNYWGADDRDIESLVRAARRLFIIASTAVLFILDRVVRNPTSQMKKLQSAFAQGRTPFNALNQLYTIILRSVVPTNCDRGIVARYQKVIGTILHVLDPLPLESLAILIGSKSEDVLAVLDKLQSIVVLDSDDVPRVRHISFVDYVTDAERCFDDDLRVVPRDQHTRITVRCFDVMNTCLKRNILELGTPAQFMENRAGLKAEGISDDQIGQKISSELRYACLFWANHFVVADTENANLIDEVGTFANEHLLHWFEALSWIRKVDLAHRVLFMLHNLPMWKYSDMREIFFDAWRFVSKFFDVIQHSALHTYHSALPFMPMEIPLYKKYGKTMHDPCHLGGGPERWDALVATPKHEGNGRVHRVAFSLDGFQLASWTATEMKLWDAKSGAPVKTFKGSMVALAGDFSVVALSQDSTLTLYHVESNAMIATRKPSSEIVRLALSTDGTRLAAGLSDGTVSLCEGSTGGSIASLGGYSSEDGQLEFSPSGHVFAFLSDDGSIQLWNGFNGESIARLSYESEEHLNIVFSLSGSRLASTTTNDGVHHLTLWNAENGEFVASVAQDLGCEPAISDDGSLVATGGLGGAVQLWGGDSLSSANSLDIGEEIFSLVFSYDMLAIGSYSAATLYDIKSLAIIAKLECSFYTPLALSPGLTRFATNPAASDTVHLWDVTSLRVSLSAPTEEPRIVTTLAFSQDCLRLATGFKDGTLELWDTSRKGEVISIRKIHSKEIRVLAFSLDGERLASGSEDMAVRLWGGRDGAPCGTLRRRFPDLTAVTFSRQLLAAATSNDITLWDCKTLHPVCTFREGSHCVSFSPDGSRLTSACNSRITFSAEVIVWDAKTHIQITRLNVNFRIERLVLSLNGSRLGAASQDGGFEFFDVDKRTIIKLGSEEIRRDILNGTLISQSDDPHYGQRVLGQFPGHRCEVPILWIPRYVRISAFAAESSIFALVCNDGRMYIGRVPPPSSTSRYLSGFRLLPKPERLSEFASYRDHLGSFLDVESSQPMDLTDYIERDPHSVIAAGGYGQVCEGKWKNVPETYSQVLPRVAVKLINLPPPDSEDREAKRLKQIKRELQVWSELQHDNILPLIGIVYTDGDFNMPAFISPWMENGSVMEFLKKKPSFPAVKFLLDIIKGLHYLHSFNPGFVHGDMKAANVLVTHRSEACLCDFGLSRSDDVNNTLWRTKATQAGGTLHWMAPELIGGEEPIPTKAGDIYAYGMTCYEILSGKPPFESLQIEAHLMFKVIKGGRPERIASCHSDDIWDLITQCWAQDPQNRPPTETILAQVESIACTNC